MTVGEYFDTAAGQLYLAVEDGYVVRLTSGGTSSGMGESMEKKQAASGAAARYDFNGYSPESLSSNELLKQAVEEVMEFLVGARREFDLPVRLNGTPFQRKVWAALREIPYGETRTYGEIAKAVGSPKGARAVGMACNRNPVMLVVPCHRVIGSTGKLVGFGGGLPMKEFLLKLESRSSDSGLLFAGQPDLGYPPQVAVTCGK